MRSSHLLTFNSSVLSSLFPTVQSYLLIYGRPPDSLLLLQSYLLFYGRPPDPLNMDLPHLQNVQFSSNSGPCFLCIRNAASTTILTNNLIFSHNFLLILAPLPEVIKNKPTAEFPDNDQVPHVSSE